MAVPIGKNIAEITPAMIDAILAQGLRFNRA